MKRFIKKIIRAILCLWAYLLIFTPKVNAVVIPDTSQVTSDWILPAQVQCYNSSKNEITTNFNLARDYESSDGTYKAYGKDYYNCYGGTNSYISVDLAQILQSNELYSITFFVGNTNSLIPNSNGYIGLGDIPLSAVRDNGTSTNLIEWSHRVRGNFLFRQPTGGTALTDIYYSQIMYVFRVKQNGSVFNFNLQYSSTPSNIWIFGYTLTPLGRTDGLTESEVKSAISSSGLATAQSVEEVKQSQAQIQQKITELNQNVNKIDDTINNSDVNESQGQVNDIFTNFNDNDFGLSDIITLPLNFINNLLSTTCSPLILPLPFVNKNLTLPCMSTIYSQFFGAFFTLYQTITTGLIAYWVCIRIYALVKSFKDPQDDKIEVVDL